jgi:hypothetical protein
MNLDIKKCEEGAIFGLPFNDDYDRVPTKFCELVCQDEQEMEMCFQNTLENSSSAIHYVLLGSYEFGHTLSSIWYGIAVVVMTILSALGLFIIMSPKLK